MAKNELVSLACIAMQPTHVYAINQLIEDMSLEHWASISRASVYAALRRLEKAEAVSVEFEKVDNMPERKVYTITELGREMLYNEIREGLMSCDGDSVLFHLAINLAFGFPAEDACQALQTRLSRLNSLRELMRSDSDKYCEYRPAVLSLSSAIKHIDIEIDVTNEALKLFKESPNYYERSVDSEGEVL